MSKLKDALLNFINKIFKSNEKSLPMSQNEKVLKNIEVSSLIKDIEMSINNSLDIEQMDREYGEKLNEERHIYNLPLNSKISEQQAIELAKYFFKSLGEDFSNKAIEVIDGKSNSFKFIFEEYGKSINNNGNPRESEVKNFNEVYCPRRGDLRDVYGIVHEVTHTFDLENGDTDARKIFGEVAPQCMERMLDDYLLNLSEIDLQIYDLNKETLLEDIKDRRISTFLSRKDNVKSFNNGTGNKQRDLRYILAEIYSTSFMKIDNKERKDKLIEFIKNIENNDITSCSKSFGIDLENRLNMQLKISDMINNIGAMFMHDKQDNEQSVIQKDKQNHEQNILE